MRKLLWLIFPLLWLAACAEPEPSATTTLYSYSAPHTPGGVLCIDQCRESHDYCRKSCALDYHACVSAIQAAGDRAYDDYARERFNAHLPAEKRPSDFEDISSCTSDNDSCVGDCDSPYNTCYTQCGGTVNSAPSCLYSCLE